MQPDQIETLNLDDSAPTTKFWKEYGWEHSYRSFLFVYFANKQQGWVVGSRGTILATEDGGKSWVPQLSNTERKLNSVHFVNAQQGWVVGSRGTILATEDGGNSWVPQLSNTERKLNSVHFVNAQQGWVVGDDGTILTTEDGGKSWVPQLSNTERNLYSVHFVNAQQGWAVGNGGTILATEDGGKSWVSQLSNTERKLDSAHFVNVQQGWAIGYPGTILATEDGGKSWVPLVSNTERKLNSVHFVNAQQGWVVGDRGTILVTQDGGKSWNTTHFAFSNLPAWYWDFLVLCAFVFLFGLLGVRTLNRSDAITAMLSSDRPRRGNESDALQSKKLAWTLSRFLRHQRTEPPLTVAINAPWGGGKSSLMNWLRKDLERFGFRPVWFNAWHYEKQEQMFPALLETIRQQAVPPWLSRSSLKFRTRLLIHRIKAHLWFTSFLFILVCFPAGYYYTNYDTTWTSIKTQAVSNLERAFPKTGSSESDNTVSTRNAADNMFPPRPKNKPDMAQEKILEHEQKKIPDGLILLLSLFPGLVPLLGLWKGMQSFSTVGNWLDRWLNRTEQSKATQETAYRAQFARDFHAVTSALDHTLIIFIDDLDRCRPENVCEIMETVNFLASEGSCYIIMGVWREGVERAIGLGFAEAAKEFSEISNLQIEKDKRDFDNLRNNEDQEDAEIRRRYGQLYLEKLINIWVSVPTMEITATQNILKRKHNLSNSNFDTTTANKIISLIRSGYKVWRNQLREFFKQFYVLAFKLGEYGFWRSQPWARQISLLWRFPVRLFGICILGIFFVVFILLVSHHFGVQDKITDIYASFTPSTNDILFILIYLFFFLLFHGITLIGFFRGFQFAVLSRLPTKPFSQTWLFNLLIITAIILSGGSVFQFGADWSSSPVINQKNAADNKFSLLESSIQTDGADYLDRATALEQNEAVIVSVQESHTLVTTKLINDGELLWLLWAILCISALIWVEWLRFRLELPDDSPAFEESLLFWSPVLAKRFDTPRRLKRFINHLRFNAMRLRTLQQPDATQWEQFWNRYIRGEKLNPMREDEMQGKESGLLLLSVLEACCGADVANKSMLMNTDKIGDNIKINKGFQPGWEENLKIDAQLTAEYGPKWAKELRKKLIEYLKYFEFNAMPQPTLVDLQQFEALAPARITNASVRSTGLSEQIIIWDQKTERRKIVRRAENSDTARFVSDRRSGIDRRMS